MLLFSIFEANSGFSLNQTGGSFPNSVFLQTTFAYNFIEPSVSLTYFGPSSSVGICNVMGYWHSLNTDSAGSLISAARRKLDQNICTDKCSIDKCGYAPLTTGSLTLGGKNYSNLTVRKDASSRLPLVDLGASDGLLSPADYYNFPDLQLLPAIAGAAVPVYNIPELYKFDLTSPLILSRSSLVNIFLGLITVRFVHGLWRIFLFIRGLALCNQSLFDILYLTFTLFYIYSHGATKVYWPTTQPVPWFKLPWLLWQPQFLSWFEQTALVRPLMPFLVPLLPSMSRQSSLVLSRLLSSLNMSSAWGTETSQYCTAFYFKLIIEDIITFPTLFHVNNYVSFFISSFLTTFLFSLPGTTQVVTDALSAISPAGYGIMKDSSLVRSVDRSFHSQCTSNGPTGAPSWCGPLTGSVRTLFHGICWSITSNYTWYPRDNFYHEALTLFFSSHYCLC